MHASSSAKGKAPIRTTGPVLPHSGCDPGRTQGLEDSISSTRTTEIGSSRVAKRLKIDHGSELVSDALPVPSDSRAHQPGASAQNSRHKRADRRSWAGSELLNRDIPREVSHPAIDDHGATIETRMPLDRSLTKNAGGHSSSMRPIQPLPPSPPSPPLPPLPLTPQMVPMAPTSSISPSLPLSLSLPLPLVSTVTPPLPPRPSSAPSAPPSLSPPPLELQNVIAEAATREQNSREATRAFYSNPSGRQRQHALARQTHREAPRVQIHDEMLMLYRDPPAWNTLDTLDSTAPATTKTAGHAGDMAVLNRSAKGVAGIRALAEAIQRKKRIQATRQTVGTTPSAVTISRNPFRRKTELHPQRPLQQSNKAISIVPTVSVPAKPLVPISTLAIPVLPQELRNNTKAHKDPCLSVKNLRQSDLECLDQNQSFLDNGFVKDHRLRPTDSQMESLRNSQSNMTQKRKRSSGNLGTSSGAKSSLKVMKSLPPKRGGKVEGSFDWKGWGKK
jgi:hypothetical protein